MNKRIEVGCLVVVVDAMFNKSMIGQSFTVAARRNDLDHLYGNPVWELDVEFPNCALANWLLRIDDYTEETETQEEEMVV